MELRRDDLKCTCKQMILVQSVHEFHFGAPVSGCPQEYRNIKNEKGRTEIQYLFIVSRGETK